MVRGWDSGGAGAPLVYSLHFRVFLVILRNRRRRESPVPNAFGFVKGHPHKIERYSDDATYVSYNMSHKRSAIAKKVLDTFGIFKYGLKMSPLPF